MSLIKFGIVSVVAGCVVVVACGGSSNDGGSSSTAGTGGTTSSTAGSSSSSAGSTARGGSTNNGSGGTTVTSTGGTSAKGGSTGSGTAGTSTGTGGACNFTMDPTNPMSGCPAFDSCVETNCKGSLDTCTGANGPCADTVKCGNACNCDSDCISTCTDNESAACKQCVTPYVSCITSKCFNEALSCNGTGGTGSGTGGTFGTGGTGFDFDAGSYTCADLAACCKKLSGANQTNCNQVVASGFDLACSLSYSDFCPQ